MHQVVNEIAILIAKDLKVDKAQVEATIKLLDEGNTVPFIARYRKEATRGLSDTALRFIDERLYQLRELNTRRDKILETLRDQGQLTPELEAMIQGAQTKARLEDLYQPYRPKRHTKAQLAKEAGLEPLAMTLWKHPETESLGEAKKYINPTHKIQDEKDALEGARQILMELFAQDADVIDTLRKEVWALAKVTSALNHPDKKNKATKYTDYFNYQEAIQKIPSHRALALLRGRREELLKLDLRLEQDALGVEAIAKHFEIVLKPDAWLTETVEQTWKTKLWPKLECEAFSRLREVADEEAIRVFTRNLRDLLLASPAGARVMMGLDPGIRTGIKLVVIDATGKILDTSVVYPFAPHNPKEEAITEIAKLAMRHGVELFSIGNGTASRETEQLVAEVMKRYADLPCSRVVVSEAGASVYSASKLAAEEMPDLDVTLRGAVSIARRLQDPLAELVKIDPKAIGVGQYQHDVNQAKLARSLEGVVEDCVNLVGVDVNTASAPLLSRIAGLNETLAKQLIEYRETQGCFVNREQLKKVPRLGPKAFEQAAGFLRIQAGDNLLDASGVHPEVYGLVEKMLKDHELALSEAIGNSEKLQAINLTTYVDENHGLPTLRDIIAELEKPGRDPRPSFKMAAFAPGIEQLSDLKVGMVLEGVVSNVTNFGAFVDVGVHQDGLVHISAMSHRFISDPHALVKAGQIVKVKVTEVDEARKRIGLTMNCEEAPTPRQAEAKPSRQPKPQAKPKTEKVVQQKPILNTAMADALANWKGQR